ncbi:MAG: Gfo/Idh/MocA family oxidoreductase [Muribaculaceae bacterium]|nr:Gfo/Idh/MocA family oxidoreductase [Muribaculaceae bacterium]
MIQQLINRYKRMRTERYLSQTYHCQYAFVGMGQHSLTNLYPVLNYLQVPLKYICVTSERKARLIERKFNGIKATTRLDDILDDEDVKGVLVAASPNAHFSIASRVLQSGKSLFIEKPPCQSLEQLLQLIELQREFGSRVAMVGLQQRYAPAVQTLKRRLKGERLLNYDLHYLTGAYPEGDALLDLYIHPLDLATWLFGKAEIVSYLEIDEHSYIMMLRHQHIVGTIELSTCHSWQDARQSLTVHTRSGIYHLAHCEELSFVPKQTVIAGIPIEKFIPRRQSVEYLYRHDSFSAIIANNSIYTQGFFQEVSTFVNTVESKKANVLTDLQSLEPTLKLIDEISFFRQH